MMQFNFQSMGDLERMKQEFIRKQRINGALLGGSLLIVGIAMIMAQLGEPSMWMQISMWWPSLVILFYAVRLLAGIGTVKWTLIMTVVFGIIQLQKLDIVSSFWGLFWPLILVVLGISMLIKRFQRPAVKHDENVISGAVVEYTDNDQ
jgi:hypothetical protein